MKSHESDQIRLATLIYDDACAKCIAVNSDLRDLKTIRSRVEHEGLSFLTITLPSFCRDLEKSLAQGYIDSTSFASFGKLGSIPKLFSGMTSLVFDWSTGRIRNEPRGPLDDISTIVGCIRQICLAFKKVEIECTYENTCKAISGFVAIEHDLSSFSVPDGIRSNFALVSHHVWASSLHDIKVSELLPKHGPGVTAERISGNQKYAWRFWNDKLEPYFPFIDSAYSMSSFDSEEFQQVEIVPSGQELPVRVVPVPKTQTGPRIIAIEPCCMQYAQQAIRSVLYERIESSKISAGHVNFSDQTVNQNLAMVSSTDKVMATLDLSDASDRVYLDLSLLMFESNPDLRDAIVACRSTHAQIPNGTIIGPLVKFASMGSALCFPIESMYFYTICIAALLEIHNLPVTWSNCFKVSRQVYVYGDDLVVPAKHATAICDYLLKYNSKVNYNKSFWNGNFRESCGLDAYAGEEVTPTYVRSLHPANRRQVDRLISWIKTASLFYRKGYWKTSSYMYKVCERYLGPLPYVSETSPGLGRTSFRQFRSIERWNEELHRFEVNAWVAEPVYRTDRLDGYAALQKCLISLQDKLYLDVSDELHLERSAQHGAAALRRRWVPAY